MKTAKHLSGKDLSLKYSLDAKPSLGFAVSTKYGPSVQRNLFKRRCRSAFRVMFINRGVQVSLFVRPKNKNVSYQSIVKSFSSVYEKISA